MFRTINILIKPFFTITVAGFYNQLCPSLRQPIDAPTPAAPIQPCRRSGRYVHRSGTHACHSNSHAAAPAATATAPGTHARRSPTAMPPLPQPCPRSGRYGHRSRHPRPPLPHSHAAAPTAMPPLRPLRPPLPAPTPAAPPQPCRCSHSHAPAPAATATAPGTHARRSPTAMPPLRQLRQPLRQPHYSSCSGGDARLPEALPAATSAKPVAPSPHPPPRPLSGNVISEVPRSFLSV